MCDSVTELASNRRYMRIMCLHIYAIKLTIISMDVFPFDHKLVLLVPLE